MSDEELGDWSNPNATKCGIVRSGLVLVGSILAIAVPLCLLSVAMEQAGLNGPAGVIGAAAVCLFAGLSADAAAALANRAASPLVALLVGMALRSLPPLIVCLILAVQGGGREHLPFVVYLLTFYLVTLALDTWWAVLRVAGTASHLNQRPS